MTDFSSVSIPPPSNWQDFERNIRLLFEYSLGDPHTQNNGRQGQAQHGVDVYGRRGGGNGLLVGVQCKGKDADYGGEVSEVELRDEVKKSEAFQPALNEFILVTTAPDDAKIQRAARLFEVEVRASGRALGRGPRREVKPPSRGNGQGGSSVLVGAPTKTSRSVDANSAYPLRRQFAIQCGRLSRQSHAAIDPQAEQKPNAIPAAQLLGCRLPQGTTDM
jgi:hypothetical protein